jgi:hypothetical protein
MMTHLPTTDSRYDAIIVFIDRFSKQIHIVPCTSRIDTEGYAQAFLDNVFRLHGCPEEIVSDRDTRFTATWWTSFTQQLGIELKMTSGRRPQADGLSERFNRSMQQVLRAYCSRRQHTWDKFLSLVEFSLNNSIQSSTGKSAFWLMHGEHPPHPAGLLSGSLNWRVRNETAKQFVERMQLEFREAREHMDKARALMKKFADKNRKERELSVGDLVLLSTRDLGYAFLGPCSKLRPRWCGPFRVISKHSVLVYELELPRDWRIHPCFNIDRLKLYKSSDGEFEERTLVPIPPHEVEGEFEYEVEDIIGHRWVGSGQHRHLQYLVLWAGYPLSEASYQTAADLANSAELLSQYRKRKGLSGERAR